MDAVEFFNIMFAESVSAERMISVWSLPSKVGMLFPEVSFAAKRAEDLATKEDVYFGTGLYAPNKIAGRGKAKDVQCITSLWADVDYGATHAKEGAPPSIVEAMRIVDRIGIKPSLVIDSGYGLHIYWLLKEPLLAEDGAAVQSRRWGATILECAKCIGFAVDSVHDVSRVMRVPGTWNYKHDSKRPVKFLSRYSRPSNRYDITDLAQAFVEESLSTANRAAVVHVSAVVLSLDRGPASSVIDAMCANDPRTKKTWERKRTDLDDQTPSSYDMAMAHVGAQMDLSDQGIADLIIAWRVKHNAEPEKALRQDYVQRTIAKARQVRQEEKAIRSLGRSSTSTRKAVTSDERGVALKTLSQAFGVDVARWVQHGTENAMFSLVLGDGTDLLIGDAAAVLKQDRFRERLLESAGHVLSRKKAEVWTDIVKALTRLREVVENPDASRIGQITDWVSLYLSATPPAPLGPGGLVAIIQTNRPLIKDGFTYIHPADLCRYVNFSLADRIAKKALAGMLRVAGWEQETLSSTATGGGGKRSSVTKSYWRKRL